MIVFCLYFRDQFQQRDLLLHGLQTKGTVAVALRGPEIRRVYNGFSGIIFNIHVVPQKRSVGFVGTN